jgi:putative transposase
VLQRHGVTVNRKRGARLTQELGLIVRVTRVTYRAPGMTSFVASGDTLRSNGVVPDKKTKYGLLM